MTSPKPSEAISLRSAKFISIGTKSDTNNTRAASGSHPQSTTSTPSVRQKPSPQGTSTNTHDKGASSKYDATRRVRELCLRWGGCELRIPGGEVEKNIIAGQVLTRDIFLSPHKLSVDLEFGDAEMDAWIDIKETLTVYASSTTEHPTSVMPSLRIEKAVYGIVRPSGDIVQHDVKDYFEHRITEFRIKNTVVRKLRMGCVDKCKEFGLPRDKETLLNNRMCLIVSFNGMRDVFMFHNNEPFTIITLTLIKNTDIPSSAPFSKPATALQFPESTQKVEPPPSISISKAIYKAKTIQVDVRAALESLACNNYIFLPASSLEKALIFGVDPDTTVQDAKYLELELKFGSATRSIRLNSNDALVVFGADVINKYELKVRSAGKARKLFLSNYSERVSKMIKDNTLIIQHTPKLKRSIHSSFPMLRGKFYAALAFGPIFKELIVVDESFGLRVMGITAAAPPSSLSPSSQPPNTSEETKSPSPPLPEKSSFSDTTNEPQHTIDTNTVSKKKKPHIPSLPRAKSDDFLSHTGPSSEESASTLRNHTKKISSPERRSLSAGLERRLLLNRGNNVSEEEREEEQSNDEKSSADKEEEEDRDEIMDTRGWESIRDHHFKLLGYNICVRDIEQELLRQPLLLVVVTLYLIVSVINRDLWMCIYTLALFIRNLSAWIAAAIRDTLLFGIIAGILLARRHPEEARRIWEYIKEEYSFVRNLRFSSMGKMLRGYFVKEYPGNRYTS